jgi:Cell wall-active antibiotics response 4TMS YvqF
VRLLRAVGLTALGAVAGVAASGALLKRALPSRGDEESDVIMLVAAFDGIELRSRAKAFRGGSILAWFGGVAVDLREATLAPDAHLTVNSVFGGVAIRVPMGWRVESSMRALSGGAAVKVPEPEDPAAPTLTLEGLALFGGIAVGTKKS